MTTNPLETTSPLEAWHRIVVTQDPGGLQALLADDVVFHSPVIHTPQRGKEIATRYLEAALHVFFNPSFRVVRKLFGDTDAMLEFESEVDGVAVNAVDILKWNPAGQVIEFKVMVRPLKAIGMVQQKMTERLQGSKRPSSTGKVAMYSPAAGSGAEPAPGPGRQGRSRH